MSYYFAKTFEAPFDEAVERVKAELKTEGFGVLTEDRRPPDPQGQDRGRLPALPRSSGACNAPFAHKALLAEDKIGTVAALLGHRPGAGPRPGSGPRPSVPWPPWPPSRTRTWPRSASKVRDKLPGGHPGGSDGPRPSGFDIGGRHIYVHKGPFFAGWPSTPTKRFIRR
ncbi:MAG: DUF302 domain-containing protein [Comamonadaceae bacterium]|nr:DUF302 domain-containing protein [Comamonadaceae bacterium]